jgi:AP-1 complex subunit mu
MVCSVIFVTDLKGKVLISRNYRGDVNNSVIETFRALLVRGEQDDCPVVETDDGAALVTVKHNNLYLVSATNPKLNSNVMMVTTFLHKLVRVFEDYFGSLEEESIRDNFVVIYELLDEMMDFGFPQFTDTQMLKEYICVNERHRMAKIDPANVTQQVTGAVGWRKDGIKHKKNEVFLDVIEKLNLLVARNGTILHSEILGTLRMKSFLSGMPELKLGLNDRILLENKRRYRGKMIEMDDVRFHQCVRLARFENDRTISFIPPDGEFELMSYRLDTKVKPLIWVECHEDFKSHSRVEYHVTAKSEFKRRSTANNVVICIPVPPDADSPKFKVNVGKVEYVPESCEIQWTIKQFQGQKEYMMKAHFGLPSVSHEDVDENGVGKAPIKVGFEIPYFTVSGIQVRYLKIIEKSGYQALPWVRYITQNGEYQIRR